MRSHVSRLGHWLLVSGALIALACTGGSDSGSSDPSGLETNLIVARSADDGVTWTDPVALNAAVAELLGNDDDPQVATDLSGTWIAAWHSTKLGDLPRTDSDILLARSTDAGASWTDYAELNANAGTDEGGDSRVQLVRGDLGAWVAIWQSWDSLLNAIGTDGDILFARSADDGLSWTDPAPLNSLAATDTEDDNKPQFTTDGAGNWVAVWHTPEGYNLPPPPPDPDDPDRADPADRDILTARSTDNAVTWSASTALNTNAADDSGGDSNPQIVTDGATWIAVWQIQDIQSQILPPGSLGTGIDDDILYARSFDAGATWTYPVPLNNNATTGVLRLNGRIVYRGRDDNNPQLATDGTVWIAVWASQDTLASFADPWADQVGDDYDIQLARSTDDGATWSDPVALNNNAAIDNDAPDISPQLTTDGTTWIATWITDNTLGPVPDTDILMARSTDAGLTWTDPEPLRTNAATDTGDDLAQELTTDEQGNWVAMWHATDWP